MSRVETGLELGRKIDALFDELQRRESPLYGILKKDYYGMLQRVAPSDAAWSFLDLLNIRFPTLYGWLISHPSAAEPNVEKGILHIDLVERMRTPVVNPDGRYKGSPAMVIPFDKDIAEEDSIELVQRNQYGFLAFDYDPKTASKNPTEDEIRSSSGKTYSQALSYRFMGANLNKQRERAVDALERILAAGNDKIIEYSIGNWNSISALNPNEPDYRVWINYERAPITFDVKILRDSIVILPSDMIGNNFELINGALGVIAQNVSLLKTR